MVLAVPCVVCFLQVAFGYFVNSVVLTGSLFVLFYLFVAIVLLYLFFGVFEFASLGVVSDRLF